MKIFENIFLRFFKIIFSRQKIKIFRWDFFLSSSRDIGESIGSDSRQFPTLQTLEFPVTKIFHTFYSDFVVTLDLTTIYMKTVILKVGVVKGKWVLPVYKHMQHFATALDLPGHFYTSLGMFRTQYTSNIQASRRFPTDFATGR